MSSALAESALPVVDASHLGAGCQSVLRRYTDKGKTDNGGCVNEIEVEIGGIKDVVDGLYGSLGC